VSSPSEAETLDAMIAGLVDLDADQLRLQWRNQMGGTVLAHLPRWLLQRVLAYRLQAATLGDLDKATVRFIRASQGDAIDSADDRPFKKRKPRTRDGISLNWGALLRKASLRCAIYTRVSTENGLEQEFNSLDNQREASEAYVRSHAHEGWKLIRDGYDDGGFSGGSMDRPALAKLLDDVRARKIDVIVVYKVDRLTRSLADFAKLVDLFDEHDVSFISVTQAFNTTTSMGRLTLNMLLSFAQFEREITSERIRDKVAASKKRGIWMGGTVPFGYRVENRLLHVVEEHAEFVRDLFQRYLEVGSAVRLKAALDAENVRLPVRICGTGRATGDGLISRGHIYWILSNPIYVGRLRQGQIHDGLHPAIVEQEIWDRVQRQLVEQTQTRADPHRNTESFLAGKLYDDRGNRMGPSHAAKGGRRWRYYVSQALLKGRRSDAGSVTRVSAEQIEKQVFDATKSVIASRRSIVGLGALSHLGVSGRTVGSQPTVGESCQELSVHEKVLDAIERRTISAEKIEIRMSDAITMNDQDRALTLPWIPPSPYQRREIIQGEGELRSLIRPMQVRARAVFVESLRNAHRWLDDLVTDPHQTIELIAAREHKSDR
jgi:DNA invertase Pin-like site-specific DNA recombinase